LFILDISVSPFSFNQNGSGLLNEALFTPRAYHLAESPTTGSPCGKAAGAASLVDSFLRR
jgi:hypothetical protein